MIANAVIEGTALSKPTAIRLVEQSFNLITRLGWIAEESERFV